MKLIIKEYKNKIKVREGSNMRKWWKSLVEFVRDVKAFIYVRRQQRKMFGAIIDDLEVINTLANALNDQIKSFAVKWNLFPETEQLLNTYRKYVDESQAIYKKTRKEILNNLLAEKQKKQISEDSEQLIVNRQEDDEVGLWADFIALLNKRKSLVGKVIAACELAKQGDIVIIRINANSKLFINVILKNRELIESTYQERYSILTECTS